MTRQYSPTAMIAGSPHAHSPRIQPIQLRADSYIPEDVIDACLRVQFRQLATRQRKTRWLKDSLEHRTQPKQGSPHSHKLIATANTGLLKSSKWRCWQNMTTWQNSSCPTDLFHPSITGSQNDSPEHFVQQLINSKAIVSVIGCAYNICN